MHRNLIERKKINNWWGNIDFNEAPLFSYRSGFITGIMVVHTQHKWAAHIQNLYQIQRQEYRADAL